MAELDEESLRKLRKELREKQELTNQGSIGNGEATLTREELKTLRKDLEERQTPYEVPYWERDFGLTEEELRGIRQDLGIKEEISDPFAKTPERKTTPIPKKPIQESSPNDEMEKILGDLKKMGKQYQQINQQIKQTTHPQIPPIPPIIPYMPPITQPERERFLEDLIKDDITKPESKNKEFIPQYYFRNSLKYIIKEIYSEKEQKEKITKYMKYNDLDYFGKKKK